MCHYHHQVAVRILTDCHLPKHISNATSRISSSVGSNLTCTVQQKIVISKQCVFVPTQSQKKTLREEYFFFCCFIVFLQKHQFSQRDQSPCRRRTPRTLPSSLPSSSPPPWL